MKLQAWVIDRNRIYKAKGEYYPEARMLEVKLRRWSRDKTKFAVDPEHIFLYRGRQVVFVNLATRQSVDLDKNADRNMQLANQLDYHTERSFWKALIERHKIPISTLLITLFAGMGIYLLLVTLLRVCGFNV